jgi:hypothetical protein
LPALLIACSAHAQATHPCAAVAKDAERLACYDAAFGRSAAAADARGTMSSSTTASAPASSAAASPVAAAAPAAAAPAIAAGSAAAASSPVVAAAAPANAAPAAASAPPSGAAPATVEPESAFGYNEAEKRERAPETVKHEPEKRPSIESTVTIVSTRRTGEFVYTLANGQVWIQTEAEQKGYVRDGTPVSIKRAALGSYKLVAGSVSTRVRRVQ